MNRNLKKALDDIDRLETMLEHAVWYKASGQAGKASWALNSALDWEWLADGWLFIGQDDKV